MRKTVAELLEEIDSSELVEWMAFYQLEPWGEEWYQTGMLASIVANIAGRGAGEPPFTAKDFMPNFEPPEKIQANQVAKLLAFGKTLKKK